MDKPDGLTVFKADDLQGRLWPLLVRKLRGVGPKTERRSHQALGVRAIGDLARVPEGDLLLHFGQSHGC